jgi:hypothetical protein
MKHRKPLVAAMVVALSLSVLGLWLKLWGIDPRLHGAFVSDREETIKRLLSTQNIAAEKLKVLRQMYGHMTYTFDGHKIKVVTDHHVVEDYPEGSKTEIGKEALESIFFVKKESGEKATLVVLPKPLWRLNETQIINIEFDKNGFWVGSDSISAKGLFEKFTKI